MIDNLKAPAEGGPVVGSVRNDNSNIRAFYAGKNIAITGVTGFVGKVLLENLLRTCPEIDTIYVFVRAKKGDDAADRTRALLRSGLFDIVRKSDPNFASKIRTLPGDLTKPQFGLGAEHLAELEQRCNVVFHCAASVAFTDPLPLWYAFCLLRSPGLENIPSNHLT
jgi:fatty acyl-CoA reductase